MYLVPHEGEPPTGDLHPHTHAHAGRTQSLAGDALQPPLLRRCGFRARLKRGVDMTSTVKRGLYDGTWGFIQLGLHSTSLRTAVEPEPVITTVDHADIRGLGTTLLVSVRRLPRI